MTDARASIQVGSRRLTSPRGRLWTLTAVKGDHRELTVHSEDQMPTVTRDAEGVTLGYDRLTSTDGIVLDVSFSVEIRTADGAFEFTASLESHDGSIVREVALPVVELDAATASDDEVVYRAHGLGRRIENPRTTLYRAHTEYMVDDGAGVWEAVAYPGDMTMPWHGVELDEGFLYMGRHDPDFSSALLSTGVPPRGEEGELWLTTVAPLGRSIGTLPPVILAVDDDWAASAARYRSWADTWYTGPHPSTKPMQGWQRIIMKHQFGQILYRYEDLLEVFEAGREVGLDGILLFGWWKEGFDRGYPEYEPDDALGGAEGLRRAIAEIRSRGGFISLYANGNLIDRTSDFAAQHGAEVTKKDAAGLDYVVGYAFARESQTLRHFAPGSFLIACHGAPRWRNRMAEVASAQAALGADDIFFDQTAYHLAAWPCYDASHDHGTRVGVESLQRARTLAGLREAADAKTLGSEGMADGMISLLNYHHGWGFAFTDGPEAFPALFRTVYPEPVVSNRLVHDQRTGWRDHLNYALTYNLIFDVALHRSRRDVRDMPEYAAHVAQLIAIRERHRDLFFRGAFSLVDFGPITHVRYALDGDVLDVYWNCTDERWNVSADVAAHSVVAVLAGSSR
ncbi:DUF6259 domain-containing protein [Microbacterium sp. Se5.02b]|uniref:DUF6259 domain-containing protein n=1 Tax=Microbacterium sp. Se5.02b TaxID=2864103 RepID=UPI001605285C|nr:DUF6259 domain-containing protein [Microbacterium sp. Se5.02b]QNA93598.1 hypothetical protein G4G29_17155 [Microbacterium sp. Se63.02b]QYM63857.1 hypothetical protein K1X59_17225 [Microbacterium sp. Se5.02b]